MGASLAQSSSTRSGSSRTIRHAPDARATGEALSMNASSPDTAPGAIIPSSAASKPGATVTRRARYARGDVPITSTRPRSSRRSTARGIVPGGGLTLLKAIDVVEKLKLEGDQETGKNIVMRSLEEPMRQIAANSGMEGSLIVQQARSEKENVGFNAASLKWEDMLKAGIIDPAKVTRSALQNAASIAALVLTTECLIADKPEKKDGGPMSGGMPGGMGGMGGMGDF